MKKTLIVSMISMATVSCTSTSSPWDDALKLEKSIKRVSFPETVFNITDFGAVANDSLTLNHDAINGAIIACNANGGGKVIVPAGEYYTGPIELQSNVNLHLEEGAHLLFSTDTDLYLPAVLTRWEGVDCYNYRPLRYAYQAENIAITGKGTINGQGSKEAWWPMNGNKRYGAREGIISQRDGGRNKLLRAAEDETPVETRVYGHEEALRPQLINFYECKTALIQDVTLRNSPFWVIHPIFCEDLVVKGVKIFSLGPNSDGCDPESCNRVLIEDCYFDTGDDCIAIKSGRNKDGRKWDIPSQNMIVRNCRMKNGHGGVVVGSEISGGYRNLYVENCVMDSPQLDRVIRIKTNNCRGGIIENIFVRNIEVGQCKEAVLRINLLYESNEDCDRSFPPVVRNVHLENVTSNKSRYGVKIDSYEDSENVYDISVKNCTFNNVKSGNAITGCERISLEGSVFNPVE